MRDNRIDESISIKENKTIQYITQNCVSEEWNTHGI
jgi:hypothetical protein